jgi:hypothetical protein
MEHLPLNLTNLIKTMSPTARIAGRVVASRRHSVYFDDVRGVSAVRHMIAGLPPG